MVGIFNSSVIILAAWDVKHSRTIANAPDFSINFAALSKFRVSFLVCPSNLNF